MFRPVKIKDLDGKEKWVVLDIAHEQLRMDLGKFGNEKACWIAIYTYESKLQRRSKMLKTNVPEKPCLDTGNAKFFVGDRIRVVLNSYSSYIGNISEIKANSIVLTFEMFDAKEIKLDEVYKLRRAEPGETFDAVPYYDEEEKEFWRTHWYTKDGIKEKTPGDIAMLEEFFNKYK